MNRGRLIFWVALGALLAGAAGFRFRLMRVTGVSMEPTLCDGDFVIVERENLDDLSRGDVIVLGGSRSIIKRLIALPDDSVEMQGERASVNAKLMGEPYACFNAETPAEGELSYMILRVSPKHMYVLGDNRGKSRDSRWFGQVPSEEVYGRVVARVPQIKANHCSCGAS